MNKYVVWLGYILFYILLLFTFFMGFHLRFHKLDFTGLSSDELFSSVVATRDFWSAYIPKTIGELSIYDSFLTWNAADNTPPLFTTLLLLWSKVWGLSDISLRSLSALMGSMAPIVFYFGLHKSIGKFAAFGGALLFVFLPSAIDYSKTVR